MGALDENDVDESDLDETELDAPFATGRTADLHALDDQVLKLFSAGTAPEEAEREAAKTRAVHDAGLPAPAVGPVVSVGGRPGYVCERIGGPTLAARLRSRPWTVVGAARTLADFHAGLHERSVEALPAHRERLARKIDAADGLARGDRERVRAALDDLPRGNAVCHGDFHPENVLCSPTGLVVIDWRDATRGHPLADVARTSLLLRFGGLPDGPVRRAAARSFRLAFRRVYLRRYLRATGADRRDVERWLLPVAAGRLSEGVDEERETLVAFVRERLATV